MGRAAVRPKRDYGQLAACFATGQPVVFWLVGFLLGSHVVWPDIIAFDMIGTLGACFALASVVTPSTVQPPLLDRERSNFNEGWKFTKGDPEGVVDGLKYESVKPALLAAAAGKVVADGPVGGPYVDDEFDDAAWSSVRLPHDWGIAGPFKQEYPSDSGKLPWWGVGWYRKKFLVAASDARERFYLDFDGAMSYASVWLNGHFVGGRPYGYSSFRVDLTPFIKVGGENTVAVRLDNPEESSRWYPGGGIYRNVWFVRTSPVSVGHWGVAITTPVVTGDRATVDVKALVENRTDSSVDAQVELTIFDGKRKVVSSEFGLQKVAESGSVNFGTQAVVEKPKLWSTTEPHLYKAEITVKVGGKVVDRVDTPFGIRTIRFDAKEGFLLNGKRTFMKGVCLHHDLGALGSAFNLRAAERQLELLKSMGFNALRTSHNPPAPEMLDLCDRMGILVLDEFSDTWTHAKKPFGYAVLFEDWHEIDLKGMILRDRNHPSVVLWSIGNEIAEQVEPGGLDVARGLARIVHETDPTRPVTSGNDRPDSGFNGYQHTIDVFGYNYKPWNYHKFVTANPEIPLYGSETASTISSRGEYFFPYSDDKKAGHEDFQVTSYDTSVPPWATTPDTEFRGQDENPSVFGEFVWTGFDYLGEPTPYDSNSTILLNYSDPVARAKAAEELKELGKIEVPSRSSYFGILDLCGFPKDRFYSYQARWRPELPMAHLFPHWNWPERVGQVTPVHLYTSGDEAELFLNGHSLGRKKKGVHEYRLRWDDVIYQPGELKAVVYKDGKPWATDAVRTTGDARQLLLKADRPVLKDDGDDLSYVTVTVADASGLMVPRTHPRIEFKLSGPGELVATDNGDATDHESFQSPSKRAFNGLCLAIIRTKKGEKGTVTLTAASEGLKGGEVQIRVR